MKLVTMVLAVIMLATTVQGVAAKQPADVIAKLVELRPGSFEAQQYWASLSADEKAAVRAEVDVASIVVESDVTKGVEPTRQEAEEFGSFDSSLRAFPAALIFSCYDRTTKLLSKNAVGTSLWRYFQSMHWCSYGVGYSVANYSRTRWAEVYAPLWDFKGHIDSWFGGGTGWNYVKYGTQGKFQECLAYCVQTKTPWIEGRGYNDGQYFYSFGG